MKRYCTNLHRLLKNDLANCNCSRPSCIQKIECSFRAAVNRWTELSTKLKSHQFSSEEKEIEFFKSLKPKFTSEIEYCTLVYHSLLFQPDEAHSAIDFWRREYQRLERFKTANPLFIQCCEVDQHQMKPFFFLRKYYHPKNGIDGRIYDADAAVSSNADLLMATWLALENYKEYAAEQLAAL
jgi:hypothetical protein